MTQPYRGHDQEPPPSAAGFTLPPHLPPPWQEPRDAETYFERDLTHFFHPMYMLDFEFARHCVPHGMAMAVKTFAVPVRMEMRRFWTNVYTHDIFYCPPQDLQKVWDTTTREAFAPVLEDLERHWQTEWLPPIRAHQRHWAEFDLERASDAELAAHLAESLERIRQVWESHFQIVYAIGHAWNMYFETYSELFEGATRLEAMTLLEGFESFTAAAGIGVWRLQELALALPGVSEVIMESAPDETLARLRDTSAADVFLAEFDDYLHAYGGRSTSINLSSKTLIEDPTPVVSQLKDALANPESDPRLHRKRRDEDRDRAIERARSALAHYPHQLRDEFERRLATGQVALRLKEDHNFVIDYECTGAMRRIVMEVARRLVAARAIENADDVFHLTLEELESAADALASGRASVIGLGQKVRERAAEMERFAGVEVPATLGPPPPAPPPASSQAGAEPAAQEPGTFTGVGMSPGVARGIVRVASTFDDARSLRPGEVLVATSTSQTWTPLFATAAALVTEAGGVLSHMGVLAREYGLPAVSGIQGVTRVLETGMLVEVDGLAGVVRVIPES